MKRKLLPIIILIALITALTSCAKGNVHGSEKNAQSEDIVLHYIPKEYITAGQSETIVKACPVPNENSALILSVNKDWQYNVYSFSFESSSMKKLADFSASMIDTIDVDAAGTMYGIYTDADAVTQLVMVKDGIAVTEPFALPEELAGRYIVRICVLGDGNRAVQTTDHIYVISETGEILADKGEYPGNTEMIRCADGGFFLISAKEDTTYIEKLNAGFEQESTYEVPGIYDGVFEGPQESPNIICAYSKNTMYLLNIETGERARYSNFLSSDGNTIDFIYIDSGSYFSIHDNQPTIWTPASEDDTVVLTLATCSGQREEWDKLLKTAVSSYNDQASKYRIEIHDYSTLNDTPESDAGITQFRMDIITGNTPDIYDLWSLPSPALASGGLLEDLYPFLDSAPKFDLIESAMKTLDCGGHLYELVPSFDIAAFFCDADIANELESMSIQELCEVYPASQIFGGTMSRDDFLLRLMVYSGKAYVDNGSATCRLNSPEFIDMLKFSTELNREEDWSYAPDSAVFSGKQMILISTTEDPVYEYQYANALFRGRAKLIGFPTNTGTGANMAPRLRVGMSVNSKEKAGVWDFMEYLLGDSFQIKSGGVRIRRDVMEPILKAQIEASVGVKKELGLFCKDDKGNVVEMRAPFQPLPQSAEEEIWAYIDRIDGTNEYDDTVLEIIQQEAAKYYDGYCTPEEAAERMQSRVSLYLAEQS